MTFEDWAQENYPHIGVCDPSYPRMRAAWNSAWMAACAPQPCGHPAACVISGDGGTGYCGVCREIEAAAWSSF